MKKVSNDAAKQEQVISRSKHANKHNVRSILNHACGVASEIVSICKSKTSAGQLLDDDELKNFKIATDLITKTRQLSIQSKSTVSLEPANITNNILTAATTDELKSFLKTKHND